MIQVKMQDKGKTLTKAQTIEALTLLENSYPNAKCALNHRNIFELLIAVVLSAQTTDKRVNVVSPSLFLEFPDAEALSRADISRLEELLKTLGMYRT